MRQKLLAATAALAVGFLLVTNPVVVEAAGQITGGQIKNETITSKDVKNGSLKGADLKDRSVGLTDLAPAVSTSLGSRAYVFQLPKEPPTAMEQSYLLTGLPAGTYAFEYSVIATMGGPTQTFFCGLHPVAGEPLSMGYQISSVASGIASASAGGVLTKTAAASKLSCSADLGATFSVFQDIGSDHPSYVTMTPITGSTSTNVAP